MPEAEAATGRDPETGSVKEGGSGRRAVTYREALFSGVPLFATRLVREGDFPFSERTQVSTPADVAAVLQVYFQDKDREEVVVLLLDTAHTVFGVSQVSIGGLASSIVEPRQVFKVAILANAAAIILAHAHPSGNPEPSREDIRITRQLVEAGKLLGIPLHDHIVIAEKTYTSLAERGLMG